MRGAIDLEHHPPTGPSFSAASVLDSVALLGIRSLGTKNLPDFVTIDLNLFWFFELLGQTMVVEAFVFTSG